MLRIPEEFTDTKTDTKRAGSCSKGARTCRLDSPIKSGILEAVRDFTENDSDPRLQILMHVHQGFPMRGDDTVSGKRQQRSALRVTL
jgi:hypothetical protein